MAVAHASLGSGQCRDRTRRLTGGAGRALTPFSAAPPASRDPDTTMTDDHHGDTQEHSTDDDRLDAEDDLVAAPPGDGVDRERLVREFGAEPLTDEQVRRLPDYPALRRRVFFAGRDLDRYLDAADRTHSVVTGVGPSGPMHLGHVLPFYLARRLQRATGAHVYVPVSDDEKYLAGKATLEEIDAATRENLRDVLAVGFDPERTHVVIDTADADLVYPLAVRLAEGLTPATVAATYGEPDNVGTAFYPAVQAAHLLLPQLVEGAHPTLVPVAADQDPHVRVCRDLAAGERLPVEKPAALLGGHLPGLDGPGKMSSSDDAPTVRLDADPETVERLVREHAHSGGRASVAEHRRHGGDPRVDVAFQCLRYFLEPEDDRLRRLAADYRAGDLLSGELKTVAATRIGEFLAEHQRRRPAEAALAAELDRYRLGDERRRRALDRAAVPDRSLA